MNQLVNSGQTHGMAQPYPMVTNPMDSTMINPMMPILPAAPTPIF